MSKKSSRKAGRVVRYQLKDGSWQEKHYPPYQPKAGHRSGDTVADLIAAWERSPKWKKLAWRTQCQYVTYMRDLSTMSAVVATKISRRDLLDLRDAVAEARGHGAALGFARAVSALFTWAAERGWLEHSPATLLQKDMEHGNLPAWTPQEAALALEHLPEHLARAVRSNRARIMTRTTAIISARHCLLELAREWPTHRKHILVPKDCPRSPQSRA